MTLDASHNLVHCKHTRARRPAKTVCLYLLEHLGVLVLAVEDFDVILNRAQTHHTTHPIR